MAIRISAWVASPHTKGMDKRGGGRDRVGGGWSGRLGIAYIATPNFLPYISKP